MATVKDIYDFLDSIAPFDTQCEWDNSGLLVGGENVKVKKIAFCLDATTKTIEQAKEFGANLIISHHPIIWDALKFIPSDLPASKAIRNKINVISCHTNWDGADAGVNCVLSTVIGLSNIRKASDEGELSMIRIGELPVPMTARDLSGLVSDALDTVVAVSSPDKEVKTVAVCGGAGGSFIPELSRLSIDAFVTGEARHNEYLDARECDISLLTAGHYETEEISMPVLMNILSKEFPKIEMKYFEDPIVEYIG